MVQAQVLIKSFAKSVSKLKMDVPQGAITYDLVKGSGKKGIFTILSFRDSAGRLIQRDNIYRNGRNVTKIKQKFYDYDNKMLEYRHQYSNNNLIKNSEIITSSQDKKAKGIWIFEKNFYEGMDNHKISYLEPTKKIKRISYNTFWDGEKPSDIVATGINVNALPQENLEYLPLFGDNFSVQSIDSRVRHIQKIQEKKYRLNGITPNVKRVSNEELIFKSGKLSPDGVEGCCDWNGQIFINENLFTSELLLRVIAHESRHCYDFKLLNIHNHRPMPYCVLKNRFVLDKGAITFAKKCKKTGEIIPNDSSLGKELKKRMQEWDFFGVKPWENREEEMIAIEAEREELLKLKIIEHSITNIFKN